VPHGGGGGGKTGSRDGNFLIKTVNLFNSRCESDKNERRGAF
jgi:hypothetical protein